MFRAILELPLLLLVATLGLFSLVATVPSRKRWILTAVFLLASAGLDFYHLFGPYQRACHSDPATLVQYGKTLDRWKAFQILKKTSEEKGPGIILNEFSSSPFDQTLTLAVFPFNAECNPRFLSRKTAWAGLVTNIHYAPFLSKRFPFSQWFDLSVGGSFREETLVLGIFPLDNPGHRSVLRSWMLLNQALHPVTSSSLHQAFGKADPELPQRLLELEPLTGADPFLRSCLEERVFYGAMSVANAPLALNALRRALTEGYPAAHLYNDLGVFWFSQGDRVKAKQAFMAAVRSPLNHTVAMENLRRIP
jgi:hypothetical protein